MWPVKWPSNDTCALNREAWRWKMRMKDKRRLTTRGSKGALRCSVSFILLYLHVHIRSHWHGIPTLIPLFSIYFTAREKKFAHKNDALYWVCVSVNTDLSANRHFPQGIEIYCKKVQQQGEVNTVNTHKHCTLASSALPKALVCSSGLRMVGAVSN